MPVVKDPHQNKARFPGPTGVLGVSDGQVRTKLPATRGSHKSATAPGREVGATDHSRVTMARELESPCKTARGGNQDELTRPSPHPTPVEDLGF